MIRTLGTRALADSVMIKEDRVECELRMKRVESADVKMLVP